MGLQIKITFLLFKTVLKKGDIIDNVSSSVTNVNYSAVEVVAIFECFGVIDSIKHVLVISA